MNEHSHVRIESPAFSADTVHLIELGGREAISQLFEFHAQVVSSDPAGLDVDSVIGSPATLVFEKGEVEVRRIGGLIAGIRDSMHEETGRMVYDLWLAPRAFRMGLVETYEIFMDTSVPDIAKKKFERAGLVEKQDFEFRLTASYPPKEFVVQYKETDLAFISRLLEHLGVSFFFEHKEGVDILVVSDANSGFAPVVDKKEVPFRSRGERLGVFSIESHTRMTPAQYVVKDYNYRTPQLALHASAPTEKGDGGFVMEYGAHFKDPGEGAQIAKIRSEELAAARTVFDGRSDRHGFSAGAMFLLEDHPRGDMELLLTEVHHRAATSVLGTGKADVRDYENSFKAIPYKTPFRPVRLTPKPRIHGVITGVIDAAAKGPYAELDADGRYRVRFLFDAGSSGDGQASRLCRMAQPHGGGGYGMHFPLRSGVEVILTFVEGDPDRPIILGVVPNPQTPSPVSAGNGTRNIIRTGGGNEINIDDTAGAERIKLSTPFGSSVIQIGMRNADDDGIKIETTEHASTNSKKSVNVASSAINAIGNVFNYLSAEDMTYYCTPFINFNALVTAAKGAIGDVLGAAKEMWLGSDEQWVKSAGEIADDREKQARAKQKKLDDEQAKLDSDGDLKEKKRQRDEKEKKVEERKNEKAQKEQELARAKKERAAKQSQLDTKKKELARKEAELSAKQAEKAAIKPAAAATVFGIPVPGAPAQDAALEASIAVLNSEIQRLKGEIELLTAEIEALDETIKTLDEEVNALKEDSAESAALEKSLEESKTQIEKAESNLTVLAEEVETLQKDAEIARRLADERKAEVEADYASKTEKAAGDLAEILQAGPLFSTASALAGYLAQLEADARAASLVTGANIESRRGRKGKTILPVLGSPKFTAGGTMNAALVAGVSSFVGAGTQATVFGGYHAALLSHVRAAVKAPSVEVYGLTEVLVTAGSVIDLKSDRSVKVVSKEKTTVTAGGLLITSKKDATVNIEEGPTALTAVKGNITVNAKAGDVVVKAHSGKSGPGKSVIELKVDQAMFGHQGWGAVLKKDEIQLGVCNEPDKHMWVKSTEIGMKRGGSTVVLIDGSFKADIKGATLSVASGGLEADVGSSPIKLAGGNVTVTGSRIDLG